MRVKKFATGGLLSRPRPVPEWTPHRVLPVDLRRRVEAGATGRPVHIMVNAVDAKSLVRMFEERERGDEWS